MNLNSRATRAALLLLAIALSAAACGDDDSNENPPETTDMSDMSGNDMDAMNMGDASATPASETDYDSLVAGDFVLLDTRPEGYDDTTGTAEMARRTDGTTVTIELSGLIPGDEYISHVHDGPCSDAGGAHYKFDPDGSDMPPNEIHLAFTADEEGNGFMTTENSGVAGDDAVSLVVHPKDLLDNKVACADFEDV